MPAQSQEIRSEEVQDILTRVPHWILFWGNTAILILMVLFLFFTWFIQYPDIIATETVVTTRTPPQKEYAVVSAAMDTLLVSDGEQVAKNQLIGMLENTAKLKDIIYLQQALDTLVLQDQHLSFPIATMPVLALGEVSSAYAVFEKDYLNYSLNKSLNPNAQRVRSHSLTEKELQLRLKSLNNQKRIDEKKFTLAESEYARYTALYEKGVISLDEFENKKLEYLEKEKNLMNLDISISQTQQSLINTSQQTQQSQITHEMENTRLFKNVVQSFNQLQEKIDAWELKYLLRAKIHGHVSYVSVWNQGQEIQSGDLLYTIVPEQGAGYQAQMKAPIQNSGKIKKGQRVQIKLHNFPETEYGMLARTIVSMSAIPDEEGFYMVHAHLDAALTTSYQIEIPFKSEMQGTAEIITEDLRLLDRFFYQIRSIWSP